MARGALRVRPAETRDVPVMLSLGEELLLGDSGGRLRGAPAVARAALEQRYLDALEDPDRHLVVVVGEDDAAIAMAMMTVASLNALVDLPAVHLSHSVVSDRHRRRGAGKALVAAAAAFAEARGLEQLVVSVHPGSREAHRFFARLGCAPMAVRRVAPVAVVRRQLAQGGGGPVDHVVPRRSRRPGRLPRRAGVPLGPADSEA